MKKSLSFVEILISVCVCVLITLFVFPMFIQAVHKQDEADKKVEAQMLMDKMVRDKQDEQRRAYDYLIGSTDPEEVLKDAQERAIQEIANESSRTD